MTSITQGLEFVNQQIRQACEQAQRDPQSVTLLAVSKTKPFSAIEQAYAAGQRAFGENYVQEGVDKILTAQQQDWLQDPIEWHFIGPLQSNKTRLVAEHFDWMQTVDRLKIAERLNQQRPTDLAPLKVCLQVNISGESTKSGLNIEQVLPLAEEIVKLDKLELKGLMAIPQATQDEQLEQQFAEMQRCYRALQTRFPGVDTLSIGMSGDMQAAINAGSTMVRIGTAIFGARN
ncbi:YggS family pyridoxal phosphate-dependent enzyme [Aliagarivorans taiwanensis]|uniref:YggS family pyridoxal phosphate-dependent enzyme n=1 Tax=Aliagarivorans taiwanensis TaxID=561966 RepID=UPI0003FDC8B7|nr:YggS family pyridoxal phosphate-dependent enzyme [Aliagarivorans taiwanensis]